MNYNKMIDHTVLKADTPLETVKRICDEAMEYGFASVCINPCHVAYCADYLKDSDVNVCTVIGFPLGANTSAVKAFETKDAIANGADEIDMVMNIGALKDKNYDLLKEEIEAVVNGEKHYLGYAHIGQHTTIHEDFLNKNEVGVHKVENASYNDYKELALELEQIGYKLEILN